jgi:uncharacterized protein YdhG (YjbR/CyaY superfamily)
MQSAAKTVQAYLKSLPQERRDALTVVREMILAHLPDGYMEVMNWGMICYEVPLAVCPDTYNGKPLMYAALASQKNHMAVYLTGVYADQTRHDAFVAAYKATGKRMDMGKSCVRFRKLEDLPLDLIGEMIAAYPLDDFLKMIQSPGSARKSFS